MNTRQKLYGALLVFTVLAQNYLAQISHLSNAQISAFTAHDWIGALLNVALAGALAWKAFLADSSARPPISTP